MGPMTLYMLICSTLFAYEFNKATGPNVGIVDVEQVLRGGAQASQRSAERAAKRPAVSGRRMEGCSRGRASALAEGLVALNQRMDVEKNLANRQVMAQLEEECEKWLATHKAVSVVSRQSLLAADKAIVAAMNARVLEFPVLPSVQVKKREDSKGSKKDQKPQGLSTR